MCNIFKGKRNNMGLSIYNISNWAINTNYDVNSIVNFNSLFYYATQNHNSGLTFDSTKWDGIINYNGIQKSYFLWIPSYPTETPTKPSIKEIQFGDGYVQRAPENLNSILLTLNLTFDLRLASEARAIIHFLTQRSGWESFVFTPPEPYNTNKLFVCKEWTHVTNFQDDMQIKAQFMESVV